jgi:enoyl-CoA hydratase
MAEYELLLYEVKDGVAFVTINRPQALNALNSSVLDDLTAVFTAMGADDAVKAVILTGEGRAFVAGADIAQMVALDTFAIRELAYKGQAVMTLIDDFEKPVIAAVNGFALGGGNELAMACDFRFASEKAKFGQPEVNLGILPFFGGTQRLPRLVGRGMASYLICSAEMIDAAEAQRIGLVERVFPPESLLEEAEKFARVIMTKSPIGVRMALLAIGEGMDTDLQTGLVIEREAAVSTYCSEDRITGMRAFLGKQTPEFANR